MPDNKPMDVVFCWHMHQPDYRDLRTGRIHSPWTYLHAIKDYTDMADHLESIPEARAVVNFAPVLLEQIEDYVAQLESFLEGNGIIHDPVLSALGEAALPGDVQARLRLMRDCLQANREQMVARFPPFERLAEMGDWYEDHPESLIYASNQFLADLLVWYHLAWMGESVRRTEPVVKSLEEKGSNFNLHERRELLQVVFRQLRDLLPRYRRLRENGRAELSMNPYAHPIVPLLLDMESAREAMPDVTLPMNTCYPGGRERVDYHIRRGLEIFERVFGSRPAGIWPSEGALSQETLAVFTEHGFRWTASGGTVLHNSQQQGSTSCNHRMFRFGDAEIDCFFRDDGLSDLIGFTYSDWHAEDAVANLISHMEEIARVCPDHDNCLIAIILDGENAWEHYPRNGHYFLDHLYRDMLNHPELRMTTFEKFLESKTPEAKHLQHLTAGSWVYGTFSTWIGDAGKNRAWDLLVEVKRAFDRQVEAGVLEPETVTAAQRQLAVCEGSDWFWWFGDYNPAPVVGRFDQLYRMHLANLYQLIKVEPPGHLTEVISRGGGTPAKGGVMRHHIDPGSHP